MKMTQMFGGFTTEAMLLSFAGGFVTGAAVTTAAAKGFLGQSAQGFFTEPAAEPKPEPAPETSESLFNKALAVRGEEKKNEKTEEAKKKGAAKAHFFLDASAAAIEAEAKEEEKKAKAKAKAAEMAAEAEAKRVAEALLAAGAGAEG